MEMFLLSDGRRLAFRKLGDGGVPVVLLHGYLDSHMSFFRMFEAISAKRAVYAPDQRGHGESEAAGDYSIAGFTADAIAFVEALGVGPVHLGGHSLGGIVAQRVAAKRPELVRSLVMIGTARQSGGNAALLSVQEEVEALHDPVPEALAREFQASTTYQPLPEAIFEQYLAETRKVTAAVWRGALRGLLEDKMPDETSTKLPALIAWGAEDGIFSREEQDGLIRHYRAARFHAFAETGHAPNWEQSEALAEILNGFWGEIDGGPTE